ncbi:arylamine N-acetyltransferase [Silvimonas sp.]|uniref:arylamine N-acetyltransferase family protein n=1 Tax=Silvimonas sp. TaxID=2650811 RepID=UPI00284B04B5|nr:arylamine N-acetyltransferase [Silvimonas sp.]MDR3425925.1 arylamine N-acetyltransferase [Silvimonas sp.]
MDFINLYLQRLGLTRDSLPADPVARLNLLHNTHQQCIAFNNIEVLLGRPPELDPDKVVDKVLRRARGGYCYELNGLFGCLLRELGYDTHFHLGKMLAGSGVGPEERPRTHHVISVLIERQRWMIDVSFGARGLVEAAVLQTEQPFTQMDTLRYQPYGDGYLLQSQIKGEWQTLYWFDLVEVYPADCVMSNYYSSTHPTSPFLHNLMALRLTGPRARVTFNNLRVAQVSNGVREETLLTSSQQLRDAIEKHLHIVLDHTEAESLYLRISEQPALQLV